MIEGLELHFGATIPDDSAETAVQAQAMESLGYEYVGMGEHFVRGNPPAPSHAALPLLGVAAGATEKIRLLSAALLAPFYHPTVLTKMATGLDIASGGRLTLGLGIGGEFPVEFEAAAPTSALRHSADSGPSSTSPSKAAIFS